MNDEACTHYSGIIDNMAYGFKMLHDALGECGTPKVAWQIDPFGHSKEQARLFSRMGMDGLFFARVDFRDKEQRKDNKTLQMLWNGGKGEDIGKLLLRQYFTTIKELCQCHLLLYNTDVDHLFTGVFSGHYNNPEGFCFDLNCVDDPINDDHDIENYNVDDMVCSDSKTALLTVYII